MVSIDIKPEPLLEDIQNYALDIVDTVREPLLILDTTLRVRFANHAFYQTFHVSAEATENRLIYELGNGQWDIPDLRTLLEDVIPKCSVFNDFGWCLGSAQLPLSLKPEGLWCR